MNNSSFLQQIQKTSNLDPNLISRQNKLNLMANFMRVKYENPKIKQCQIANQIGLSTNTLQRFRNDINMFSPYIIKPNNTNKRTKKTSNTNSNNDFYRDPNLKRLQMTSNDLKRPQSISESYHEFKPIKSKNKLKSGANIEINEHYLNKILDNNKL